MTQAKTFETTERLQFATNAIHAGQDSDPATGALITPIYQTSTFALDELGVNKGYKYARTHNLTLRVRIQYADGAISFLCRPIFSLFSCWNAPDCLVEDTGLV